MQATTRKKYSILGFDREEEKQERDLGAYLAQLKHPGNTFVSLSRQRGRVARHRHKEGLWSGFKKKLISEGHCGIFHNKIPIPVTSKDRASMETQVSQITLHEILDLLPYITREEAIRVVLEGDGRGIRRMGTKIRGMVPPSALE